MSDGQASLTISDVSMEEQGLHSSGWGVEGLAVASHSFLLYQRLPTHGHLCMPGYVDLQITVSNFM